MTRIARVVIPDVVYHITQRGNNRQDVFFVEDDQRVYLDLLAEECERHALTVLGYCLMTNHVHLVAVPHTEQSLAKAIGRTDWRYTRYVNRLHRRSGHLWHEKKQKSRTVTVFAVTAVHRAFRYEDNQAVPTENIIRRRR